MINKLDLCETAAAQVVRASHGPSDELPVRGVYRVEHLRNGQLIGQYRVPNTVTNEAKNKLLEVMFGGASAPGDQITSANWKAGLVDNANYSATAAGDTYAQIDGTNGWDEFQAYTESSRQSWGADAAASQAKANSTPVVFTINAAGAVRGLFLAGGTNAATKGDHASGNILWSAAAFTGGAVTVGSGDQLKVTYTVLV